MAMPRVNNYVNDNKACGPAYLPRSVLSLQRAFFKLRLSKSRSCTRMGFHKDQRHQNRFYRPGPGEASVTISGINSYISAVGTRGFAVALLVFTVSGCVSQSKYDELMGQKVSLERERDELTGNNELLKEKLATVETEKKQVEEQLSNTEKDLAQKKEELNAASEKLNNTSSELESTNAELTKQANLLKFKKKELELTSQQLENASAQLQEKDQQLSKTQAELQAASKYVKNTQKLYEDLVGELKGELAANEIKIQQMKDGGINLNLSDKILFASGQANLNQKGSEVLKKVSQQLKENKYRVLVSGHTDNIPIRGSLTKRYPTNWELAGARAASVVRLLEKNGVRSDLLIASSYGSTKPVASNDSEEGRALNRRIEIRLRAAGQNKPEDEK